MSENIFKSGPPAPNTTLGWLNENIILTNLKWDFNYTFKIRTFNFNSFNIYSDWVELNVFEENLSLKRRGDQCAVTPLKTLENSFEQNFNLNFICGSTAAECF